jgi:hypothetical protein
VLAVAWVVEDMTSFFFIIFFFFFFIGFYLFFGFLMLIFMMAASLDSAGLASYTEIGVRIR